MSLTHSRQIQLFRSAEIRGAHAQPLPPFGMSGNGVLQSGSHVLSDEVKGSFFHPLPARKEGGAVVHGPLRAQPIDKR